ncbi:peptidoglycan DD-metalloendopeptidase family protein [Planococcus sp. ISL-110]|uniref:M23 family metallopeptidase n=1 Tax=Planococcus sp. ISL-110 TaxID=2819167 RepID=UPI001BE7ABA6|nr:peptidoglycan DD-metalloendopeptidase family protein [Planococcus sp. ISL-110]MBT2569839.1 peptidoglycan DD-metalloendopeptidase family protein [Planococcus sp. ISL-110]
MNDGRGSNAGQELVHTPDGKVRMFNGTDIYANLPKGTQVISAINTKKLLENVPAYNGGKGLINAALNKGKEFAGDAYNKVAGGAKKVISKVVDVFDYVKNPGKLLNLALEALSVTSPQGGNFIGDMAKGAYSKVKSSVGDFVKGKINEFGGDGGTGQGFGSAFRKTSSYGFRIHPVTKKPSMHSGDDYGAPAGTRIPSQAAGRVVQAGYHAIRGNYVRIKSGMLERIYQHNTRNLVGVGDAVKKGQYVGTVGSTGRSTGPHLHYEVLRNGLNINPKGFKTGGLIKKQQFGLLGEEGEEVVIPTNPSRRTDAMKLLALAARKIGMGDGASGSVRPNQLPNVSGGSNAIDSVHAAILKSNDFLMKQGEMLMKQNEILMQLLQKDSSIVLDSGALVGGIGNEMDAKLGKNSTNNMYMNGVR